MCEVRSIGNYLLEQYTEASYVNGAGKKLCLQNADLSLKKLLVFIRFGKDLGFVSYNKYELFAGQIIEIGKQTSGWLKWSEANQEAKSPKAEQKEKAKRPAVTYNTTSPLIQKYLKAKTEQPDKIIAVKTGAFYKLFFNDAKLFNKQFGFKLRNLSSKDASQKIISCGFPVSASNKYQEKVKNLLLI